ncbi:hypothetical protein EVAR_26867_1 [Eumeta japonica]|uniref:Uncharacterized protein n=1 Tax=Eumeta variegata TaxID=151549 RepID=A0A4C1VX67_EUMVA|nr:hypothetical protein EVAR_26867_1 [Eumeta japonica]
MVTAAHEHTPRAVTDALPKKYYSLSLKTPRWKFIVYTADEHEDIDLRQYHLIANIVKYQPLILFSSRRSIGNKKILREYTLMCHGSVVTRSENNNSYSIRPARLQCRSRRGPWKRVCGPARPSSHTRLALKRSKVGQNSSAVPFERLISVNNYSPQAVSLIRRTHRRGPGGGAGASEGGGRRRRDLHVNEITRTENPAAGVRATLQSSAIPHDRPPPPPRPPPAAAPKQKPVKRKRARRRRSAETPVTSPERINASVPLARAARPWTARGPRPPARAVRRASRSGPASVELCFASYSSLFMGNNNSPALCLRRLDTNSPVMAFVAAELSGAIARLKLAPAGARGRRARGAALANALLIYVFVIFPKMFIASELRSLRRSFAGRRRAPRPPGAFSLG